jgi:segregation and condensation protein A
LEKIQYKLDLFEGPMDLLLYLISKHKLSIHDIPILDIVEQYLSYVKEINIENLDTASEFLEMAARLVYIKTVSLLPAHEEADKLADELKGELTEYLDCQIIAGKLNQQAKGFDFFSRLPQDFEENFTYTRVHDPVELYRAYLCAIGKGKRKLPPPIEAFSGIVTRTIVSVTSRISFILQNFANAKRKRLLSFFEKAESRSEMVATFLAILTLAKAKRISFEGNEENTEVVLLRSRSEATGN